MNNQDFNLLCANYLHWNVLDVNALRFNSDWNYIMLVVNKILEECAENGDYEPYNMILDSFPVLEDVKKAIYNYLTNYVEL